MIAGNSKTVTTPQSIRLSNGKAESSDRDLEEINQWETDEPSRR